MFDKFEDKVVVVFGASKGIGLATAKLFASKGANVVLAARTKEAIEQEASELVQRGFKAFAQQCDVSHYPSVQSCVEFCVNEFGGVDIVVNNAGVIEPLSFLADSDPDVWARAVDINFKGVYHAMRAAIPHMLKVEKGLFINLSSGAANSILEGWSHYCSTKNAVKKLTEVADKELRENNIRVVGLSPGTVATDMMRKIHDAKINVVSDLDWNTHIPPEWPAEAVLFLCGTGAKEFYGTDFSIKTPEGRRLVGLPV